MLTKRERSWTRKERVFFLVQSDSKPLQRYLFFSFISLKCYSHHNSQKTPSGITNEKWQILSPSFILNLYLVAPLFSLNRYTWDLFMSDQTAAQYLFTNRKRKRQPLPTKWSFLRMIVTHKQTEVSLKRLDDQKCLCRSEESGFSRERHLWSSKRYSDLFIFFGKSFLFLFLFLCYVYFGTFSFQVVIGYMF